MPTPTPSIALADVSRPTRSPDLPGPPRRPLAGPSQADEALPRASAPPQAAPSVSQASVSQATREIADYMQSVSRALKISVDEDLGATVIRVLDPQTDKLIRQIPPEEALALARFIAEQRAAPERGAAIPGILLDRKG